MSGYRVCLVEVGQALLVGEADSNEERGGSTPRPQDGMDIVEVPPTAGPRLFIV